MPRTMALVLFLFASLAALPASAQSSCFSVAGQASGRGQYVIGISDEITVDRRCEVALDSDGPWVSAARLAGRATDFLEVYEGLLAASAGARRRATRA